MSGPDEGAPPPPEHGQGWTPPGTHPAPGGQGPGSPPPGPWAPAPAVVRGAAHKPGAVPLRPLGLGDVYDAAFKIIRHNPRATVGAAALVAAGAMAVPVVVALVVTTLMPVDGGLVERLNDPATSSTFDPSNVSGSEVAGLVAGFGALLLGSILQWVGLVLVTGMIAHVTMAAALGRTMGLGEAWAATRGRRGQLVGLTFLLALIPLAAAALYVGLWIVVALTAPTGLIVLFGLVTVPLFLVLLVAYWVRVQYLAVPPLMLEGSGVRGALGRAFRLSSRQFWRLFGIAALTTLVTGVAAAILGIPVTVAREVLVATVDDGQVLILVFVGGEALATVISSAFVTPFTAGVASLLYLDQRIRKEGFDVELLSAAGIPTGGADGAPGGPGAPPPGSR